MKDEATAPPAVRLFADYCRSAPAVNRPYDDTNPYKGRFKFICNTLGLEELGVPAFIRAYNAKPGLIRQSGKLFRCVRCDLLIVAYAFEPFVPLCQQRGKEFLFGDGSKLLSVWQHIPSRSWSNGFTVRSPFSLHLIAL